ncbi:uncharacterized protein [Procambarus clarkii]|uniref:uncharacterized protein n=1 Tax=Procambarus clarkii TaxID=6728 RepID=UPI00374385D7
MTAAEKCSIKLEILKLQLEAQLCREEWEAQLKREEQERETQLSKEEQEAEAQLKREEREAQLRKEEREAQLKQEEQEREAQLHKEEREHEAQLRREEAQLRREEAQLKCEEQEREAQLRREERELEAKLKQQEVEANKGVELKRAELGLAPPAPPQQEDRRFKERLILEKELAGKHLKEAQRKMLEWYDKRATPREFQVGSQVMVLLPGKSDRVTIRGTVPGAAALGPVTYEIGKPDRPRKKQVCHEPPSRTER